MKCPRCGAGLSSKYRVPGVVHPRKTKRWPFSARTKPSCGFTF